MGPVEVESLARHAVIQMNIKAAGNCDQKLMQAFVRMAASFSPSRYIVKIINPAYGEGNVIQAFDTGEVSTGIVELGQVNQSAIRNHELLETENILIMTQGCCSKHFFEAQQAFVQHFSFLLG